MTIAVYLPLLLALPLWWAARPLAARGSPAVAARGQAGIAAVAAVSSTWSLVLLALTLFDDWPPLAALNRPGLNLPEPVPDPIGLAAALILLVLVVRLGADLRHRLGTQRRLRRIGDPRDGLLVADWTEPMAVAVPGRPGHVLVTTGLLRELSADERRVVFAHEHAHLRHRHHMLVLVSAAAAAVNPLLIPARQAVGYLVERWADEEAAAEVGDRGLAARAVARAALATTSPSLGLSIGGGVAVQRVRALGAPAPAGGRRRLIGPMLLAAGFLAAIAAATVEFVAVARAWL
jgi:Zn-dependent protease with chaperone function